MNYLKSCILIGASIFSMVWMNFAMAIDNTARTDSAGIVRPVTSIKPSNIIILKVGEFTGYSRSAEHNRVGTNISQKCPSNTSPKLFFAFKESDYQAPPGEYRSIVMDLTLNTADYNIDVGNLWLVMRDTGRLYPVTVAWFIYCIPS